MLVVTRGQEVAIKQSILLSYWEFQEKKNVIIKRDNGSVPSFLQSPIHSVISEFHDWAILEKNKKY